MHVSGDVNYLDYCDWFVDPGTPPTQPLSGPAFQIPTVTLEKPTAVTPSCHLGQRKSNFDRFSRRRRRRRRHRRPTDMTPSMFMALDHLQERILGILS